MLNIVLDEVAGQFTPQGEGTRQMHFNEVMQVARQRLLEKAVKLFPAAFRCTSAVYLSVCVCACVCVGGGVDKKKSTSDE